MARTEITIPAGETLEIKKGTDDVTIIAIGTDVASSEPPAGGAPLPAETVAFFDFTDASKLTLDGANRILAAENQAVGAGSLGDLVAEAGFSGPAEPGPLFDNGLVAASKNTDGFLKFADGLANLGLAQTIIAAVRVDGAYVAAVAKRSSPVNRLEIVSGGSSFFSVANNNISFSATTPGAFGIYSATRDGAPVEIHEDGILIHSANLVAGADDDMFVDVLGWGSGRNFPDGAIQGLYIANGALSPAQRAGVEADFSTRFGIPLA